MASPVLVVLRMQAKHIGISWRNSLEFRQTATHQILNSFALRIFGSVAGPRLFDGAFDKRMAMVGQGLILQRRLEQNTELDRHHHYG